MFSKITLLPAILTVSIITLFVIYFLWREYSIAKKMLSISAARKCLQKKILPFSMVGMLIMSIASLSYFHFSEKFEYLIISFSFIFYLLFLTTLINFLFSRSLSKQIIFAYLNNQEKEGNFFWSLIFIVLSIFYFYTSDFSFTNMNLCLGMNSLILSFDKLKIVEEGIIYKFRLINWNNIRAYKNTSGSFDWDRNPVFKITLWVRPSILHMSSFVQIPVNSQDVDSINQILTERLPGKNL